MSKFASFFPNKTFRERETAGTVDNVNLKKSKGT